MRVLRVHSELETASLAAALAEGLSVGDAVLLRGTLGMGKTAFARYLIRAMVGKPALEVVSPTFLLMQDYQASDDRGGFPMHHYDFYRVEKAADLWELGVEEQARSALSIAEWPEIAAAYFPPSQLCLTFCPVDDDPQSRDIQITLAGALSERILPILTQWHEAHA